MSKSNTNSLEKIGIMVIASPFLIAIIGATSIYGAFAGGYVSLQIYKWFVLPAIPTLPAFTLWQFSGFHLFFLSILPYTVVPNIKDDYLKDSRGSRFFNSLMRPWILLGIAWIIKLVIQWLS